MRLLVSSDTFQRHPLISLSVLYLLWKVIVLLIVFTSSGIGYDTSGSLFIASEETTTGLLEPVFQTHTVLLKLIRWDAIYFCQIAQRGRIFEQEWAFGVGISSVISALASAISNFGLAEGTNCTILAGAFVSHVTHWLCVIVLWGLVYTNQTGDKIRRICHANTAAVLHIISPAGVFLSAPYSEALFAFLNMLGFLLYTIAARQPDLHNNTSCITYIASGTILGLATVVRSNGILGGLLFLKDAALLSIEIIQKGFSTSQILRLSSIVIGGILLGMGMLMPQYLAYTEYCTGMSLADGRPWCKSTFPSIYTWVQSHYWNVGFLRYWTPSNLPLFALAMPSLWLLIHSSLDLLLPELMGKIARSKKRSNTSVLTWSSALEYLAITQLVLAVTAFTTYHVQIINRLSSAYPCWYIWLADKFCNSEDQYKSRIVRWMIMYAIIQAGLYASFLPPA